LQQSFYALLRFSYSSHTAHTQAHTHTHFMRNLITLIKSQQVLRRSLSKQIKILPPLGIESAAKHAECGIANAVITNKLGINT